MRKRSIISITILFVILIIISCQSDRSPNKDLISDQFPEAQAEILEVIQAIVRDAETANIEGLKKAHLKSNKFTKFGPRSFNRQDVESTNDSEAFFFGSISNFNQEVKDLKIDVFGDIGIATYYPIVTFEQGGEKKQSSGRQTLVFLKTDDGWKIVHEHGTPKH